MTAAQRWVPWVVVLLAGMYLLIQARPLHSHEPFDLQQLGHIPVSADGRVKPLDTVARNSLMIISGRQSFRIDGKSQPAIRWLADVIARPEQAQKYPVLRVDHPEVLALIGLTREDGTRFSFEAVMSHHEAIADQARRASEVKPKERDAYQKQVLELFNHLILISRLSRLETPYMIPPLDDDQQWQPLPEALNNAHASAASHAGVGHMLSIWRSYRDNQPDQFNTSVASYLQFLDERVPQTRRRADLEVFFNHVQPFYHTTVLYVIAFVLGCLSFLLGGPSRTGWPASLGRTTLLVLLVTFAVHTFGLGARVYLQQRPPVTNLYSSAVFIGWGCVAMAMFLEWQFRLGLGSVTAALIGFVTLLIAHHLGGDGDTMEMMQAVLDSNFWLATHVVAIAIGYSATFLAGFLAILFILAGVFTRGLDDDRRRTLGRMVYGVICFAMLFSFVGTVLGGIWADQSWGRFWGWDPKENGAVLIVLMNALILHARWGGMIRERGMMVLAVAGNIVTSWSWFGTNMLGVGLHSYGFMESALFWLLAFVLSQLVVIGIGVLPLNAWRSYNRSCADPL